MLADRHELAATVAAVGGEAGESMRRATGRAEERAARLVAQAASPGRPARFIASGLDAVAKVIDRYRRGDRPATDQEAAWLTVLLRDLRVRDDAWARMDPGHQQAHQHLWTDLTCRARPGYVPAPASLLALAECC